MIRYEITQIGSREIGFLANLSKIFRMRIICGMVFLILWLRCRGLLQLIVQVLRSLHGDVDRLLHNLGEIVLNLAGILADGLSGVLRLRHKGLNTLLELGTQLIHLFRRLGVDIYIVERFGQLGPHVCPKVLQLGALGLDLVGHVPHVCLDGVGQVGALLLDGVDELLLVGQVLLKLSAQVVDDILGFSDLVGQLKGLRASLLVLDVASWHNLALCRDQEDG